MKQSYFLTGALGCIGAWVTKTLADRGDEPTVFDLGDDRRRLAAVMDEESLARVRFVQGDITDLDTVMAAVDNSGARKIIHLAGLQVPFCRADPALGAKVNVVGTIHMLEAAKRLKLERVVYASSAAVYGADDGAAPNENASCHPSTHYGVYKAANEGNARIFWNDDGIASVGIRPLTVYGVGRDQGMTSGPTVAMKAAVLERPYSIGFSGATDFNYVGDTAAAFVECADRAPDGAHVFNLHGESVRVERIVEVIRGCVPGSAGAGITVEGPALPIPPALDGSALHAAVPNLPLTPLEDGVAQTIDRFRSLHSAGRLDTRELE